MTDQPLAPSNLAEAIQRSRVWVLEDELAQAKAIEATLRSTAEVKVFIDSFALAEALSLEQPDVLVLDWHMPKISGLHVLSFARETYDEATLPILVVTALPSSSGDMLDAMEAGANDFVSAPLDPTKLRARVSTLLRIRLLHQRALHAKLINEDALANEQRLHRDSDAKASLEQQLIGIVAHDLRTPINAITLSAGLLVGDTTLTERQATSARLIVSAAMRTTRLVEDLLDFTAIRQGHGLPLAPAPVDLHQLARTALAELQLAYPLRKFELRRSGKAEGIWDPDRLAQVISNLVSNAVQHSNRDSTVTIETVGEEKTVSLLVSNQGAPIPEALVPRLFLPMQSGPGAAVANRRNLGLGLYIVNQVALAHGGRVEVSSTAADGTRFAVHLPLP